MQPVETDMLRASYGLGSDWYDYDSQTHILTARPVTWRYTYGDKSWNIGIDSYYHPDTGSSGYFTLVVESVGEAPSELSVNDSVKDGLVCVDLDGPATVSCDTEAGYELVLRTDARPLPAAGFAVVNPALYFVRGEGRAVSELSAGAELPLVSERDGSAGNEALATLLASPSEGHVVQLTADLQIAQWRILSSDPLTIESRCTPVGVDAESTSSLGSAAPHTTEVTRIDGQIALLDLCPFDDEAESKTSGTTLSGDAFRSAGWPDNRTFDLFVGFETSGTTLRSAPESAFEVRISDWNSEAGSALPTEIWEDTF